MGFRELLVDQLCAARDAAEANELLGEAELGLWWRSRARDLQRYLDDLSPAPATEPGRAVRANGSWQASARAASRPLARGRVSGRRAALLPGSMAAWTPTR